MSGHVPQRAAAPAVPPRGRYAVDEEIVYGAPPPPGYYYDGPYYRPYWGWRRHWW